MITSFLPSLLPSKHSHVSLLPFFNLMDTFSLIPVSYRNYVDYLFCLFVFASETMVSLYIHGYPEINYVTQAVPELTR